MKSGGLEEMSWRFLEKLYELSEGGIQPEVHYDLVKSSLGYSNAEARSVVQYLESKDLITFKCKVPCIKITPRGVDEADRVMTETYRNKERRVLQKLYDERERRHTSPHTPEELASELGLDLRETQDIVVELERKGWAAGSDQATWIISGGMEEIEAGDLRPGAVAPNVSYTTNIHGPNYGGIQQGGRENTQNVTLTNTNNADLDRVLVSIVELIRASNLPTEDKQELESDVASVNKLALREPAPGLLEKAKSRLDLVRLGIQGTELAVKLAPHIDTALELLRNKFG